MIECFYRDFQRFLTFWSTAMINDFEHLNDLNELELDHSVSEDIEDIAGSRSDLYSADYARIFNYIDAMLYKAFMSLNLETDISSAHNLVSKILKLEDFQVIFDRYENEKKERVLALALFAQNVLLRASLYAKEAEVIKQKEILNRLGKQRDNAREELRIANNKLVQYSSELELLNLREQ